MSVAQGEHEHRTDSYASSREAVASGAPPRTGGAVRRGGGGGGGPIGNEIDFRQLLGVIRRHKLLIIGLTVFVTVCAALYTSQLTPLYRAQAQLVIERQRSNVLPMEELVRSAPMDWQTAQTETAVISSRELARRAVDRLELKDSPMFNPRLRSEARKPSPLDLVKDTIDDAKDAAKHWLRDLGVLDRPVPAGERPEEAQRVRERPERPSWEVPKIGEDPETSYYVSAYLSGLSVRSAEMSRVISVAYVSTDPEFAAAAANTSARLYIEAQREEKGQVADEAAQWLDQRVAEAKEDLIQAERELEQYRDTAGITDVGRGQSLETEQLARLNAQLSEARARLAEARARFQQVQNLLDSDGNIDSAAAVLDSNLIETLRLEEVELQRRIAELSSQYREDHPKMIYAKAELEDLRSRIRDEVNKIAANLRNEVDVARARVSNIEQEVSQQRQRVNALGDAQAQLRALQSEVEANRQLYETLLDRFKEISVQDERAQEADARLINLATRPGGPFYPNTEMIIIGALMLSAAAGIGLAFAIELLDNGYRALQQLEDRTGVPAIAAVPKVRVKRNQLPHNTFALARGSHFAEAIRMLRTGVAAHTRRNGGGKVLLVTSSVPGEGKTTTALSIAAQDADSKRHAVVVDCDLRVSNLGKYLEQQPDRLGLTDYLRGRASLRDIITRDSQTGLHFITAGSSEAHPDDALGSEKMQQLLEALSQEYARVVLDAPPVLAVADTAVLVPEADAIIYAVRWGSTRRDVVEAGLKRLDEAGAGHVLAALTFVDLKRQAQYGYAEAYYGYGAYYAAQ